MFKKGYYSCCIRELFNIWLNRFFTKSEIPDTTPTPGDKDLSFINFISNIEKLSKTWSLESVKGGKSSKPERVFFSIVDFVLVRFDTTYTAQRFTVQAHKSGQNKGMIEHSNKIKERKRNMFAYQINKSSHISKPPSLRGVADGVERTIDQQLEICGTHLK